MSEMSRRKAVRQGIDLGHTTSEVLGDLVLDRIRNPVTAFHVLSFIAVYGAFVEAYGREPKSLRELGQGTKRNGRTLDRWSSKFREAFPEYSTPAVLWSHVRAQMPVEGVEMPDVDQITLRLGGAVL